MLYAICGKTMENLRNRINVRLVSKEKDYLTWTTKPSYMSQKIFDNNLVATCKNKVTLTLNKPAYVGLCILDLSNLPMYEFHYDYIKNKYGNNTRLLISQTLIIYCMELKSKMFMKILVRIKNCLILVIILVGQNIMMDQTN